MRICKKCNGVDFNIRNVCTACLKKHKEKYYQENKDKKKLDDAKYRARHPDKIKSKNAAYYAANKKTSLINYHNRQAKKLNNGNGISKNIAEKLFYLQHGKCACCGKSLSSGFHIDHIIPLFLGGKHEDSNIQLLTPRCNLQKSKKHPIDFFQSRGFLI